MSKSDDEKAALQSGSGGAGLPSLAGGAGGGIRVPGDFIDEVLSTMEQTAIRHECDAMQVTGRRGWVKKLQSYDWKEEFVIVSKNL